MGQIIKSNEEGALYLPSELLGSAAHTCYTLERDGETIVLRPLPERPKLWISSTPKERAAAFREWAMGHEGGPNLPDEALSRESIYE